MSLKQTKKAVATLDSMRKVFSLPESEDSTLRKIEQEISQNLLGFLSNTIVSGEMEPAEIEREFQSVVIPDEPMFVHEQVNFLMEKVVSQSVHTASPGFIGHMTSSMPYFMLPLAKIMFALNQNTVKIETSKAFTPLESQVIGMMHNLIFENTKEFYERWTHDREHALGVFCSGGTIANLTALWAARNNLLGPMGKFRGVYHDGLFAALNAHGYQDLAVLVSRRGHYSLRKAADILGLGRSNLIAIETDENNKLRIDALKNKIKQLRKDKIGILAIVGIAGTTETGNVDPLDKIAEVSEEEKIHFHVDGAWGVPTLFSERHKHLLNGISQADSVAVDAHKQLYSPMGAGMCLFKKETALDAIQTNAEYIIRRGSRDLGKHTLEGSRPGMAMIVHSGLRILGRKGYEILIDVGIGKAAQFAKMIQTTPDFELTTAPELNILTYRYRPPELKTILETASTIVKTHVNELLSELTVNIQKIQRDHGKTFVSRTSFEIPSHENQVLTVFRVVLANPLTTRQVFVDVLEEQREIAAKEMKRMNFDASIQMVLQQEEDINT
jgi:glutamate decarboxylase